MKRVLSILMLSINIIFVILLLASTLSGFVSPSQCVWISMLSYGYVFMLVVNLVFIFFWLFFSSKYFLISLAAILIRYSFIPLYYQVSGTDNITDERYLKLLTFNVHHFTKDDDACKKTIALIKEKTPDVICFQEFASMPGKINVYDSLKNNGYSYHYSHFKKNKRPRGTVIFSKYPIVKKGLADSNRCIFADIKLPSDTVRVYNIHLASYRLDEEDRDEIDRIKHGDMSENSKKTIKKFKNTVLEHEKEVDMLISHVEKSAHKTIMCGDLNDTPASYTYQKLANIYSDSFVEKGEGLSTTYNGMFPAFRIDYILHHKDFKTDSYKRMRTNISDHYPVFVSIEMPTK